MWKQSREIVWSCWLKQSPYLGKPNWLFMIGCSCFIFLDLSTLTLVLILVCLCWLPRHLNHLSLMPSLFDYFNIHKPPVLFKLMVLFTVFHIVTHLAKVPCNQNWPFLVQTPHVFFKPIPLTKCDLEDFPFTIKSFTNRIGEWEEEVVWSS